jgi:hypothetical protein
MRAIAPFAIGFRTASYGWIPAFAGMTADKIALFQRLT